MIFFCLKLYIEIITMLALSESGVIEKLFVIKSSNLHVSLSLHFLFTEHLSTDIHQATSLFLDHENMIKHICYSVILNNTYF